MNIKNSMISIIIILCGAVSGANAAALGDISVCPDDHLPLVAELPILDTAYLSEAQLTAQLASDADLAMMGMRHTADVKSLLLFTDFSANGSPRVRISGCPPAGVQRLQFVIELRWPRGRLLREYTIELGKPKPDSLERVAMISVEPIVFSRLPGGNLKMPSGSRYMVNPGDTLWRIASSLEHNRAMQDVVREIHRLNPQAFIEGSTDMLRADVILRLP